MLILIQSGMVNVKYILMLLLVIKSFLLRVSFAIDSIWDFLLEGKLFLHFFHLCLDTIQKKFQDENNVRAQGYWKKGSCKIELNS